MQLSGKRVLVLGGSGVLGGEFCNQLTDAGAIVSATARDAESSLRIPAHVQTRLLVDLESEPGIQNLANYLLNQQLPIDLLINATGLVAFGSWQETPEEIARRLMQVNFFGPGNLFGRLNPLLKLAAQHNGEAYIVNISGVVAEKSFLGMAAYSSSKVAASNLIKTLGQELRRDGIRTLEARPGHTETGLAGRAIFGVAPKFAEGMTAQQVVARIVRGIKDGASELAASDFS